MDRIYSEVDGRILATFLSSAEVVKGREMERIDGTSPYMPLQVAMLGIPAGHKFRAHKHLPQHRPNFTGPTQECWVVLYGSIRATVYDVDDKKLAVLELGHGDVVTFYAGGHNYENVGTVRAVVIEIKQGPYVDQKSDKEFLV